MLQRNENISFELSEIQAHCCSSEDTRQYLRNTISDRSTNWSWIDLKLQLNWSRAVTLQNRISIPMRALRYLQAHMYTQCSVLHEDWITLRHRHIFWPVAGKIFFGIKTITVPRTFLSFMCLLFSASIFSKRFFLHIMLHLKLLIACI